jgi:hypothetical protein
MTIFQLKSYIASNGWMIITKNTYRSRDSSVSIATDYRLDNHMVEVRIPVGSRILSSPRRPHRPWAHPTSYLMGTGGKAAGA